MARITRANLLKRGATAAGAVFAAAFVAEPVQASRYMTFSNCITRYFYTPICLGGTTSGCRVQYGPPDCSHSSVTVYSPSSAYHQTCHVTCNDGCLGCEPIFNQARGATGNGGSCSCTPVA
jgi:hypothetical protein